MNARCQQGGLELTNIVRFSGSGTRRYSCNGHEVTPTGRRQGDPCDNFFDVELSIERLRKVSIHSGMSANIDSQHRRLITVETTPHCR